MDANVISENELPIVWPDGYEVEAQRRQIAAMRRVARLTAKPTKYSVKALSLLTLGRGALIRDMASRNGR